MNYWKIDEKIVYKAYKKFKSNIHFDKTELAIVNKIVEFEEKYPNIKERLNSLYFTLKNADEKEWKNFEQGILDQIDVVVCPKKLTENKGKIIFNVDNNIKLESVQYFIDLPVEGHILGVLWIFFIGRILDEKIENGSKFMNKFSFGNRVSKKLINSSTHEFTETPFLFESYFSQYDSWREEALESAKKLMQDKKDAVVLNLDIKRFFYSIQIPKDYYDKINEGTEKIYGKSFKIFTDRLHEFVYNVLSSYSYKVRKIDGKDQNSDDDQGSSENANANRALSIWENSDQNAGVFLPIGFLPSNILSNWYLTPFDNAVNDYINPIYYGRYVDDIIIVNKVEEGSKISNMAKEGLSIVDIIDYYFVENNEILLKYDLETEYNDDDFKYKINPKILLKEFDNGENLNVIIQNDKVKVFYFDKKETTALIDCFKNEIGRGASEFRFLPEIDDALFDTNFGEVLNVDKNGQLPKLRNIENFNLDKFALSKFLGKYRKVSRVIEDENYNNLEEELLKLLSKKTLVENYTLWDRLLEIMLVNNNYDHYDLLVHKILQAIDAIQADADSKLMNCIKKSLGINLYVAICKTATLCWGKKWKKEIDKIKNYLFGMIKYRKYFERLQQDIGSVRLQYWHSYMINKYMLPIPIVYIDLEKLKATEEDINISRFKQCFPKFLIEVQEDIEDIFLPYAISPQEISYAKLLLTICQQQDIEVPDKNLEYEKIIWKKLNTFKGASSDDEDEVTDSGEEQSETEPSDMGDNRTLTGDLFKNGTNIVGLSIMDQEDEEEEIEDCITLENLEVTKGKPYQFHKGITTAPLFGSEKNEGNGLKYYAVRVGKDYKENVTIGIGNICLEEELIANLLIGKLDRSYLRYKKLANILALALKEKVELLVLPESYIPIDWLLEVYRFCTNNQIALVTGIEHVVSEESVYNLTAVILPYEIGKYRFAHIEYHQKVHFSPEETRQIEGHELKIKEGDKYTLFNWQDLWFSVYCCFELTSIIERAKFQSLVDMIVAVEWNKDVVYFNSVIDSLTRDLHCYCVQANNAKYGDNRIVVPAKGYKKDLIKSKGGTNEIILVDKIELEGLRKFQCKKYELQKEDGSYKPTPPNFNRKASRDKMSKRLWEKLAKDKD